MFQFHVIVKQLCVSAAEGVKLQCGREYGFARATDLTKLTKAELKDLPTNNLAAQRDLAKFSNLAKFRNKRFKARSIRTDMVLYQSDQSRVDHLTKKIYKALCKREDDWTESQRHLQKGKILEKMAKTVKEQDYMLKLLRECKTWCGPWTSCDELAAILQHRPDKVEKIVKTELAYYRHTHKSDMIARPELFKLIRITHEERLENLFILPSDNNLIATASSASIVDLPTDDDALQIVNTMNRAPTTTIDHSDIQLNEMRIILWNVK